MKKKFAIIYRFPKSKFMYHAVREYENAQEARNEHRINGLFCCYITTLDNLLTYRDREYEGLKLNKISTRSRKEWKKEKPHLWHEKQAMSLRIFEYIQTVFIPDLDEGLQDNFRTIYEKLGRIA